MRDQLERDGFIILRGLLPSRLIEDARQRLVSRICGNSLALDDEVIDHIRQHPDSHHLSFRKMGDQGFNLVFPSECISIAATAIGGETVLNPIQHVRAKAPTAIVEMTTGKPDPDVVPWHRDCYFEDHAPACLDMITVWIPLCDVDRETGTLLIASRSHLLKPPLDRSVPRPTSSVIAVEGRQGDAVVLHKNVVHGSGRNVSNRIRYSLDFRVQTSSATLGMSDVPSVPYKLMATIERRRVIDQWRRQQDLVQRRAEVT